MAPIGSYVDNPRLGAEGSDTAEVAVNNPQGEYHTPTSDDSVRGYQTPEEVAQIINEVANY